MTTKTLEIRTSPHIASGQSTDVIMRNVVVAALPVAAFAIYSYGLTAILLLLVASFSCVVTEHLLCKAAAKESTIGDWSAAVTGLLYGLTLPPALPLWMVAVGGVFAIALGKVLFGGLGYNVFNPALVGRAVVQGAFPVALTTWSSPFFEGRFQSVMSSSLTLPFVEPVYDVISGYRSPATNAQLRKKSKAVAKRSLHMLGKAIDVRLTDVDSRTLRDAAIRLKIGGVGYYARSDFVHLDTGRFRTW